MSQVAQPAANPVNTKTAPRRNLRYASFEEIAADLDRLEAALDAGTLTHTGNWTPGQVFEHTGKFLGFALDGFTTSAPAPVRWISILLFKKKATQTDDPIPAGFKLPKAASVMLPRDDVGDREGLDLLRTNVDRVRSGEKMIHPSPIFGKLTHEEWLIIQRKHVALHLSFLHPDGPPGA